MSTRKDQAQTGAVGAVAALAKAGAASRTGLADAANSVTQNHTEAVAVPALADAASRTGPPDAANSVTQNHTEAVAVPALADAVSRTGPPDAANSVTKNHTEAGAVPAQADSASRTGPPDAANSVTKNHTEAGAVLAKADAASRTGLPDAANSVTKNHTEDMVDSLAQAIRPGLALRRTTGQAQAQTGAVGAAAALAKAGAASRAGLADAADSVTKGRAEHIVDSLAGAGGEKHRKLIIVGCAFAFVLATASLVFAVMCCYQVQGSTPKDAEKDPRKPQGQQHSHHSAAKATEEDLRTPLRPSYRQSLRPYAASSMSGTSALSSSVSNQSGSRSRLSSSGGPDPQLLPLCPDLVVSAGMSFSCCIQETLQHSRQELAFNVITLPEKGGCPIIRVRVSEADKEDPGIHIEALGSKEKLAFLSTEELWEGRPQPVLSIRRPHGLPYGTFQQHESGGYCVFHGHTPQLMLMGDFQGHNVCVKTAAGKQVAFTKGTSEKGYQLHIQENMDAGLIVLSVLAADKCNINALGNPLGSKGSSISLGRSSA